MILVSAWLPDPVSVLDAGAFGAGALIRIESAATIAGVYAEITTLPIVATQVQYQYWDPAGTATTWYRWRVSDAGNAIDSDYSAPLQGTNQGYSDDITYVDTGTGDPIFLGFDVNGGS